MNSEDYPTCICRECGLKHGEKKRAESRGYISRSTICTYHENVCGWCGETKLVTAPRHYGYPPTISKNK